MSLYAPLYIANFCENRCANCGFQAGNAAMPRRSLPPGEIDGECRALASTGMRSILILTGESRRHSPPSYIREAIEIAGRYFPHVAIEVYPLATGEYRDLYRAGADGVTLFQETYDRERYDELHLAGPKKNYDFRVEAPARIAEAGFRQLTLGVLLGLSDWRAGIPALFRHVRVLERAYPGIEYAFSLPRLRPVAGDSRRYFEVTDRDMVRIICAARLMFPSAGINISTRENPEFRDRIVGLGVTRMSAGSLTTVGGYAGGKDGACGEGPSDAATDAGQFDVHDPRGLAEIKAVLTARGYDPVVTDWRSITNE